MRIALIADSYPPLRNSAAIQIKDLSNEFSKQGHDLTVYVPDSEINQKNKVEISGQVTLVRLRAFRTKDVGYIRRVFAEFMLPYLMMLNMPSSVSTKFDGVVWYSPTIFLTPFTHFLKQKNSCKTYLIIRDIFPDWVIDLGLMRKGLAYLFFKLMAWYQYAVADVIGIQSKGNKFCLPKWVLNSNKKIEVLNNWVSIRNDAECHINISKTKLANRKIFIYAGNVGVAQNVSFLMNLIVFFRDLPSVGFIFIGRGAHFEMIKEVARKHDLQNTLFYNEIDPSEIITLYNQCHVGLVALDVRHKTHNIPGKFLSYMQAGIPVLAIVNPGNDLIDLIKDYKVGIVCTEESVIDVAKAAQDLLLQIDVDPLIKLRCSSLADELFSVNMAVHKIVAALHGAPSNS